MSAFKMSAFKMSAFSLLCAQLALVIDAEGRHPLTCAVGVFDTHSGPGPAADVIVVLIGPDRWPSAQRAAVTEAIHETGRTAQLVLDVYPVRQRDLDQMRDDGDTVFQYWMRDARMITPHARNPTESRAPGAAPAQVLGRRRTP